MTVHKLLPTVLIASIVATSASYSAAFSFGAAVANNLTGVNGAALAGTDQVEIGTYTGGVFSSLFAGSNNNVSVGAGFFSHAEVAKQNTNSIAGEQLAIRWSNAGETAILYYDITTTGGDSALIAQWSVKAGDGGGTDFAVNAIDISDLTTGEPSYNTLVSGAVLVNAELSSTVNAAGAPSFSAVPEPSTYAMFAGVLALGYVMIRRRR